MQKCRRPCYSGFTLVEMAMVLLVMGLVMLTMFPALSMMRTANQRALTQSNLQNLMLATAAYVQANGCLPCPTPPSVYNTNPAAFGRVRGDTSLAPCGACPAGAVEGIPPFLSLGIPASAAHDGYGYWITMRVDPALTAAFGIVPPTAPCSCTAQGQTCVASSAACGQCSASSSSTSITCISSTAGESIQGLCQTGLKAAGSPVNVCSIGNPNPQPAAVIFVSHGAHGYGSFVADIEAQNNGARQIFPTYVAACSSTTACAATAGFARCNATGDGIFYDVPYAVDETGAQSYDDVLAYADRNTLVSRFGNGSCQTVW